MERETVPLFVVKGERLVDVGYAEIFHDPRGGFIFDGTAEVKLTEEVGQGDRIIIETGVGCYQLTLPEEWPGGGDSLFLESSGSMGWSLTLEECVVKPSMVTDVHRG